MIYDYLKSLMRVKCMKASKQNKGNRFIAEFAVSDSASPDDIENQCQGWNSSNSEITKNALRSVVDPFRQYKLLIERFYQIFRCSHWKYTRPADVPWTGSKAFSWMVDEYYFLKGEYEGMEVILFYGCAEDIGIDGLAIGVREKREMCFTLAEKRGEKKLRLKFDAIWIADAIEGKEVLKYTNLRVRPFTSKGVRSSIKLVNEFLKNKFSDGF